MSKHAEHGHHMTIIKSARQRRAYQRFYYRQKNGWKKKLGRPIIIVSISGLTPEILALQNRKSASTPTSPQLAPIPTTPSYKRYG